MKESTTEEINVGVMACTNCGADLKYKPGTHHLTCTYCGTSNEIQQLEEVLEELDYHSYLAHSLAAEEVLEDNFVKCNGCGATSTLASNITSACCPYCTTSLIIEEGHIEAFIQPKSLLPFKLAAKEAKEEFKKWVKGLWFAPNDLMKTVLNVDRFKGVYLPYWTFDTFTYTSYIGQRGEYYYVNENYTTTENGKSVTKSRRVRKTRWIPVSGRVQKNFDDILTVATRSLPQKYVQKLAPWDLENLIPFEKSYLSGFITEKYQIDLEGGFEDAKAIAEPEIRQLIGRDIGGDEQRIVSLNTEYKDITFKHLLLPVFVSAYNYKGKLYQFLVNGRTGEVQGERPYSWTKIILTVLLVVAVIAIIVLLLNHYEIKE